MKAHFEMFAAYNAWANRRLYDAAAKMPEETVKAPCGAFFGSLFGALNHLIVGDLLWMRRIEGAGPAPSSLDDWLHPDLKALRAAREALDERIVRFAAEMSDADAGREISYTMLTLPGRQTQRLSDALAHMFNHQTHHRGQCHHMLTAAGEDAPPLDLLYFQKSAEPAG